MANRNSPMFLIFILFLSFALVISMGESKMTFRKRSAKQPAVVCNEIYGTQVGDTCFSIIKAFGLTPAAFSTFNPNLNCDKVFVGEWLCINASAT